MACNPTLEVRTSPKFGLLPYLLPYYTNNVLIHNTQYQTARLVPTLIGYFVTLPRLDSYKVKKNETMHNLKKKSYWTNYSQYQYAVIKNMPKFVQCRHERSSLSWRTVEAKNVRFSILRVCFSRPYAPIGIKHLKGALFPRFIHTILISSTQVLTGAIEQMIGCSSQGPYKIRATICKHHDEDASSWRWV